MSSDSDKRNTRVEMDYLKRFQSLSPIPEPKELFTKGQTAVREVSRSPNHLAKALKRKRMGSPEDDTFNTEAGPLDLILPQATDAGIRSHEYVGIQNESPWQSLQKVYELKLDGFIYVAIRKSPSCELVTVKNFLGSDKDRKVKRLQQTQHENFVGFLEAFQSDGSVHVILEYIPISLAHIVKSPAYPTELQLAAILGQVNRLLLGKKTDAKKTQILAGLNFLASKSLEHGALTCSNVLVNGDGVIKIASQECCRDIAPLPAADLADVKALGYIAIELMQKYPMDDGATGVEDLDHWPSDSKAVQFLSLTTSTTSIQALRKHPLITSHWRKEELKWMVALAGVSAYRGYKYV